MSAVEEDCLHVRSQGLCFVLLEKETDTEISSISHHGFGDEPESIGWVNKFISGI